jgi:hypothetical protein
LLWPHPSIRNMTRRNSKTFALSFSLPQF